MSITLNRFRSWSPTAQIKKPEQKQPETNAKPNAPQQRVLENVRAARIDQPRSINTLNSDVNIYDASQPDAYGGALLLGSARTQVNDSTGSTAAAKAREGLDYFANTFGRDGIDGRGSRIDLVIRDRSTDANGTEIFRGNGGYFATTNSAGQTHEALRFGLPNAYQAQNGFVDQREMFTSKELMVHELTHGMIRKETGELGGQGNEAGATNEALADVMGAASTRDWRIGEKMYHATSDYTNLRNIANPSDQSAIHGLATHINQIRELQSRGEALQEHWASGVITTAAARIQDRIGGEAGWRTVEHIVYDTINSGRLGDLSFNTVAGVMRDVASNRYGSDSNRFEIVDQELRRNGL